MSCHVILDAADSRKDGVHSTYRDALLIPQFPAAILCLATMQEAPGHRQAWQGLAFNRHLSPLPDQDQSGFCVS